ncbi:helix-turn-helix domain-containing protein [Pseudomonas aeruginosa]|uniref:helix-turn-helix domain-containing protein n=2 Tax=Pseudomonas TaxID=286 RepID=UPI0009A353C2|nr:helix-turn-helix domain-containing protein [Pseudomonas aeruginosa]MBI7498977.1 winged helix-turn-helix domain-containing protein [Pseudomonas aeruginosa]MBI8271239.1 winged helix-turn-helix domain-containing protein [Pseudomonas aeruginosa]MBI8332616.1 winged helix-turn-helix domain-containing protein [Pseudomonas aeruginosa]MCS7644145.1 helix-turn-helix domain-containing protein [Pseudomonas aeruginosa]NNB78310.1 winged helix-turn-helix domain-containing protein [Pseudomonas aeruginosa]
MLKEQENKLENKGRTMIEEIIKLQHKAINTITDKVIFLIIRNGSKDKEFYPISRSQLARMTGLSISTVATTLKKFKEAGLIEVAPKQDPRETSRYRTVPF